MPLRLARSPAHGSFLPGHDILDPYSGLLSLFLLWFPEHGHERICLWVDTEWLSLVGYNCGYCIFFLGDFTVDYGFPLRAILQLSEHQRACCSVSCYHLSLSSSLGSEN
jgi:hypothetical protein